MAVKCLRQEKMGEWGKHFYRSVKRISIAMEGCRRGNVRAEAEGEWRKESIIIEKPVVDYDRRFISFFPLISPLFFTSSSPASVSFGTRRTREGNEKGRKKYSGRMQRCSREHLPASNRGRSLRSLHIAKKRVNGRSDGAASAGTWRGRQQRKKDNRKKEEEEKEEDRLVADRTIDLWWLYIEDRER